MLFYFFFTAGEVYLKSLSEQINELRNNIEDKKSFLFSPLLTKESTHSQFISIKEFRILLYKAMEKYNKCSNLNQMDLVFFDEMVYHSERLCRVVVSVSYS